jgi:hypothetical protein
LGGHAVKYRISNGTSCFPFFSLSPQESLILATITPKPMNEFLIVIHRDLISKDAGPSPEQMQASIKPFQDWIGGIAAQNKLVDKPRRWDVDGRVVKQNNTVTNGPYAEIKESVGGLLLIRAQDYEEAVEIAKGCPALKWGAVVEVRMALSKP